MSASHRRVVLLVARVPDASMRSLAVIHHCYKLGAGIEQAGAVQKVTAPCREAPGQIEAEVADSGALGCIHLLDERDRGIAVHAVMPKALAIHQCLSLEHKPLTTWRDCHGGLHALLELCHAHAWGSRHHRKRSRYADNLDLVELTLRLIHVHLAQDFELTRAFRAFQLLKDPRCWIGWVGFGNGSGFLFQALTAEPALRFCQPVLWEL
mmetsp:Transcript_5806/g.15089  ORF Transcript_5806/g.15089 Transcript_5806/m.15089 type:complete len:209 (-) Transcript_5806:112-738(-)